MATNTNNPNASMGMQSSGGQPIPKPVPQNAERYTLSAESELRLEVPANSSATISLISGSAEIFGAELVDSAPCYIPGPAKFAIFSWYGSVFDVEIKFGTTYESYESEENDPNIAFVNTHAQLEALRDEALLKQINGDESGEGPRVLIAGPADSGKTSLAKILIAYAAKIGRMPTLVDLDVSQNLLSIPGTVAASTITLDNISPAAQASSTNIAPNTSSLVLWHGSTDIKSNTDLYKAQVKKLGESIDLRLNRKIAADGVAAGDQTNTNQMDGKASGIIVNTSGWIEDKGYQMLLHTVEALRINVILVLKSEKLYSMLVSNFKKVKENMNSEGGAANFQVPKVIKLRESGGLCPRNTDFRSITRRDCIKRYFYGDSIISKSIKPEEPVQIVSQYTPGLIELPFSELTLYRLSGVSLSASMLPVSAKQATDAVQLTPVKMEPSLTKAVMAVCHPTAVNSYMSSGDARDLYLSGISGFVVVDKIDVETEILSLLSPCAGELPSKTLLVGDVAWIE